MGEISVSGTPRVSWAASLRSASTVAGGVSQGPAHSKGWAASFRALAEKERSNGRSPTPTESVPHSGMAGNADDAQVHSHGVGTTATASQPSQVDSNPEVTSNDDLLRSSVRRLYEKHNLKITKDTLPAFSNSDLIDEPSPLGEGAFNTVYAVHLEGSRGSSFDGVFKPLASQENGWAGHASGIPIEDPQTANRNLATLAYAEHLGLDVIADTRLGVLSVGQESAKLGLVMERAAGVAAIDANPSVFNRGDVAKEVTRLQLLDHLTGQVDRHAGNYFIDAGSCHSAKVTGIDNDQAFGKNLSKPDGFKYGKDSAHIGYRGTGLPPAVDRKTANAINAISSDDIRQMLGSKLSGSEVRATISRHKGLMAHIADLSEQGRVINTRPWWHLGLGKSKWDQPKVQNLFTAENSYFGREREMARARQAQNSAKTKVHQSL